MGKPLQVILKVLRNLLLLFMIVATAWWVRRQVRRVKRMDYLKQQQMGVRHRVPERKGPDDGVILKSENPRTLQDEKNLKGRTLWVSAGGQMKYYPYNGHSVDFGHTAGVLLGAQKVIVQDAVLQAAPKEAASQIPQGDGQVLLVFTLPDGAKNLNAEYAVAVGDKEDSYLYLLTDQIFYYEDPHKLYAYWGKQVWDGIDQHKAILGMNERQVQLALGQVSTPRGDMMGDRAVEFDGPGTQKLVTFVNGKAIEIREVGGVAKP